MYTPFTHREAAQLHTKSLWLEINPRIKPILDTPTKAELHITQTIAQIKHESIHVLFLTPRNHLIKNQRLWRGSLNGARFGGANLLKACTTVNAARIIMVHHNPNGTAYITPLHESLLNFTQHTLKLKSIRVDDFFLIGRPAPSTGGEESKDESINPEINITSMAREQLVPKLDVTSEAMQSRMAHEK